VDVSAARVVAAARGVLGYGRQAAGSGPRGQ
jgi:hypothetical protein